MGPRLICEELATNRYNVIKTIFSLPKIWSEFEVVLFYCFKNSTKLPSIVLQHYLYERKKNISIVLNFEVGESVLL